MSERRMYFYVGLFCILIIILTTTLIIYFNHKDEVAKNDCINRGGTYTVVGKQLDASTSTWVDVYGCVKKK